MKRVSTVVIAGIMALAVGLPAMGRDSKTVKGEVVDVACHAKKAENRGASHESCAMSCAKRGNTMGILTADGVYEIAGPYAADNNKNLIQFVAKTVEATGEVTEKDGKKTMTVAKMAVAQ